MKKFFRVVPALLFLYVFVFTPVSFSQGKAPLGKLLSKQYEKLAGSDREIVLIYFRDKGDARKVQSLDARGMVSDRALARRSKVRTQENLVDENDLPVHQSYIDEVARQVVSVRHALKWFNAVSVVATKEQIESLRRLPYVKEIELVGRWSVKREEERGEFEKESPDEPKEGQSVNGMSYGGSYTQLKQIDVPALHALGIYGQGVMIGMFDDGFKQLDHVAFDSMSILATYDFVENKVNVVPSNPNAGGAHGINTLSIIGAYSPGQVIGPAFKADFVLARTEDGASETPIEEDNWARAIEWADSIGIDVASTSLGYIDYDAPYPGWTWENMDGNTTLITRAADRAVGLGIVVLNSAGNSGPNGSHNTLGAPSDGDSVLAVGAVDSFGVRSSFSSVGPTVDGRIKPDIMAMGTSVRYASGSIINGYGRGNGTSYSCPLSAGVAALILCANPELTPLQVREAMRMTASRANSPNNTMGWGIINALSAARYFPTVKTYSLREGWNLLSLPLFIEERRVDSLYPGAYSPSWYFTGRYERDFSAPDHLGFWLKSPDAREVTIEGVVRYRDTVAVRAGWNITGMVSFPLLTSQIRQVPEGIVTSQYYMFDTDGDGYTAADTLLPHTGYWVKTSQEGLLIFESPGLPAGKKVPPSALRNERE